MNSEGISSRKISVIYEDSNVESINSVRLGRLLEDLLLFETVIIQTQRLNELPYLVKTFGFGPVRDLIRSDSIEFSMLAPQIAVVNSDVPTWKFEYGALAFADFQKVIEDSLNEIRDRIPAGDNQFRELRKAVHESFRINPKESSSALSEQFRSELTRKSSVVYASLAEQANSKFGVAVSPDDLYFNVEYLGESDTSGFNCFEVDTNLAFIINKNARQTIDLIGDALLGVGGLNSRINKMRIHRSLSGIREEDRSVLDSKLSWIIDNLSLETRPEQFRRVVSIRGFPDLQDAALQGRIDLEKLIQLRETQEIRQFRNWLRTSSSLSRREMEERVSSAKSKISSFLHTDTGKLIRWMATTGLGMVSPVLGSFTGLMDQFLADDLLGQSGPIFFLNALYPSIYQDP